MSQVQIADEVLATIVSTATLEADGVAGFAPGTASDIAGRISRKKNSRGVAIRVADNTVRVSVEIAVTGGVKIQDVAADVQHKIKNAVETMTGFIAGEVNVHVTRLVA